MRKSEREKMRERGLLTQVTTANAIVVQVTGAKKKLTKEMVEGGWYRDEGGRIEAV